MELLLKISENLQSGDDEAVANLTRQAMDQQIPIKQILDAGLIAGMQEVGRKFKEHEIFLPDVLVAARAMYAGLNLLKPLMIQEDMPHKGKVVLGTVKGDLHDIGKNLVGIMLRGAGYEVIDIGNDVPPQKFVETAMAEGARVLGLSALLTTTMMGMKQVVELLRKNDPARRIRVIVGGAPLNEAFAREIGADAYGYDAVKAVEIVDRMYQEV